MFQLFGVHAKVHQRITVILDSEGELPFLRFWQFEVHHPDMLDRCRLLYASISTPVPGAVERFDVEMGASMSLQMVSIIECPATMVKIAGYDGRVSCYLVIEDIGPIGGNLVKLTAINATRELACPVVTMNMFVQSPVSGELGGAPSTRP